VKVRASLEPATDDKGPHDAPVRRARVVVQNLSGTPLAGVEVHFGVPGSDAIELVDYAARAGEIDARSEAVVELAMEVGPKAPDVLPLEVMVEDSRFGALADWPLPLPEDGSLVVLQPPTIAVRPRKALRETVPSAEPAGPLTLPLLVRDDRAIDHVLVWVNGEKVAWAPGSGSLQDLLPTITLLPGDNRIVVTVKDDQGITARRSFSIRGEVMQAATAAADVIGADPASADERE
jgi:hypothetical protein